MKRFIGDIGEHALIKRLTSSFVQKSKQIRCGVGDDGAIIASHKGDPFVMTTDMLLEKRHFRPCWTTWREIGKKSIEVNLSDLAAMGAWPRYALLSLGLPLKTSLRDVEDFYRGASDALRPYMATVIGGDTNASPGGWVISVTMIGDFPKSRKKAPLRNRAKAFDRLYVSGHLGESALGLYCLEKNIKGSFCRPFIKRHLCPKARVLLGRALTPHIHAMIDLSDGLVADLGHILQESRKGAWGWREALPFSLRFIKGTRRLRQNKWTLGLSGGEDYELLFTASRNKDKDIKRIAKAHRISLTPIGEVSPDGGLKILNGQGRAIRLQCGGFSHF